VIDRAIGTRFVVGARVGRTDLGETTVTVDEDSLHIVGGGTGAERSVRVLLASVDAVEMSEGEVVVLLRDGRSVRFYAPGALELREDILARCCVLPELTHALRAFGSRRGHRSTRATAASDQRHFFAPLLEARRQAVTAGTSAAAMAAFDADALAAAFEAQLQGFAAERYGDHPPARRALEAELIDLSEPLQVALGGLREAAGEAGASPDDLQLWRMWARQLATTFETADRVWLALDTALDASPWKL
jgi:hypothetical protein